MKKSYDPEFKVRAVRMVQQHREGYRSLTATCTAIGGELGVMSRDVVMGILCDLLKGEGLLM